MIASAAIIPPGSTFYYLSGATASPIGSSSSTQKREPLPSSAPERFTPIMSFRAPELRWARFGGARLHPACAARLSRKY